MEVIHYLSYELPNNVRCSRVEVVGLIIQQRSLI